MLTDGLQMYCLEKSEHASVAAKIVLVLFLSFEKKDCQVQSEDSWGLRPKKGEWESLIFIVLGPKFSL